MKSERKNCAACNSCARNRIGNYIVDFYCSKLKLVIEIDGESHSDGMENDLRRQDYLEGLGLTVLRFEDDAIKDDLSGVLDVLKDWIGRKTTPQPPFVKWDFET